MTIRSISQLIEGRKLVSVTPDTTAQDACAVLDQRNIGALAVVSENRLVGILSERDLIRRCFCRGASSDTPVAKLMTSNPQTIRPSDSIASAMETMLEGRFRHVPVMNEQDEPIGMVSMRDIPTQYRLMVERFREYNSSAIAAQ